MLGLVLVLAFIVANALIAPALGVFVRKQSLRDWWLS